MNTETKKLRQLYKDYIKENQIKKYRSRKVKGLDKYDIPYDYSSLIWNIIFDLARRVDYFKTKAEYLSDNDKKRICDSMEKSIKLGYRLLTYNFAKESEDFLFDNSEQIFTKLDNGNTKVEFRWKHEGDEEKLKEMYKKENEEFEKTKNEFFDNIRDNIIDWWY